MMSNVSSSSFLKTSVLNTPLGTMVVVADHRLLYVLAFSDRCTVENDIERLKTKMKRSVVAGVTLPILSIQTELKAYFDGTLRKFTTPIGLLGSPFYVPTNGSILPVT